jgi:hypothetical protein
MTTSKQISRILVVVTAIGALLLLAGPASASSKPAGMTKAEYRALMLRSQALNLKYGLGEDPGMTKAEYRALMLRSQGLNKKYHLGAFAVSKPAVVAGGDGFAWSAFGIGAAATLGLVLVAGGAFAGSRRRPVLRTRSS